MFRLVAILIGYAFGLFQTAFILGKIKGIDIREHGSGNAGTTNTMRVLGTKAGLIVFLGDCLKCVFAILISVAILQSSHADCIHLIKLYTGFGAILGHNFPFYMNFRGGKGVACTAGLMFSFDPWFTLVGLIVFFSIFFTTHYVSLGSLCIYPYIIIMTVILGIEGYFGCTNSVLIEMCVIEAILLLITTFMHRTNINRLINHCEKKTYLSHKDNKSENKEN